MGTMTDDRKTLSERIRTAGINISVSSAKRGRDEEGWERDSYRVRLTRSGGRQMTLSFHKGIGHAGNPPQLEEVLEAILSDAAGIENAHSFEEWADEYGFDSDGRKAEAIYRASVRQTDKLRAFLGDDYQAFLWETDNEA